MFLSHHHRCSDSAADTSTCAGCEVTASGHAYEVKVDRSAKVSGGLAVASTGKREKPQVSLVQGLLMAIPTKSHVHTLFRVVSKQ